ncbi:MAG: DUF4846 domain-containing protein [Polyangiaceae bacterium]
MTRNLAFALLGLVLFGAACERKDAPAVGAEPRVTTRGSVTGGGAHAPATAPRVAHGSGAATPRTTTARSSPPLNQAQLRARYAWLDGAKGVPDAADTLERRFGAPNGFTRVTVAKGSFGEFLRTLPLAAEGTPVNSYAGARILEAGDSRYAAVVALDVGAADLQQCADAAMRLHAEWRWSMGARDMSYRAAAGMPIEYARYRRGERLVPQGTSLSWAPAGRASDSYATFRRYLDAVFAWANTVSLEKQAQAVSYEELRAGDFFILPGNPGHTVLILDVVSDGTHKRALLGQSYMPAQNFHVLRPRAGEVWFELDATRAVKTPFWAPFPWSSLRRL